MLVYLLAFFFFFFNDTATTEIYTLSLHDALPISHERVDHLGHHFLSVMIVGVAESEAEGRPRDRKSTRLNSSHSQISYAVFCLKKKKKAKTNAHHQDATPTRQQRGNTPR